MTYKHLKKFLADNTRTENIMAFDLIPNGIRSKAIFIVGESTGNTGAFLSSIMSECNISHSRYINSEGLDLKNRFINLNSVIDINKLCESAKYTIKKCKKLISNDTLLFILSLDLLDGSEYIIIEISEMLYSDVIEIFTPNAIIFALNDDKKAEKYIQNAPLGVAEIITLSQNENKDYISNSKNANGARISYASQNKITPFRANLLGTEFYHFNYLYHIPTIDQRAIPHAHLAIEAAAALFAPSKPLIYKGLENARPTDDFEIYSISPNVLLWKGEQNFELYHKMKYKIVTNKDEFATPTENTVFCGDTAFIAEIKEKLK